MPELAAIEPHDYESMIVDIGARGEKHNDVSTDMLYNILKDFLAHGSKIRDNRRAQMVFWSVQNLIITMEENLQLRCHIELIQELEFLKDAVNQWKDDFPSQAKMDEIMKEKTKRLKELKEWNQDLTLKSVEVTDLIMQAASDKGVKFLSDRKLIKELSKEDLSKYTSYGGCGWCEAKKDLEQKSPSQNTSRSADKELTPKKLDPPTSLPSKELSMPQEDLG